MTLDPNRLRRDAKALLRAARAGDAAAAARLEAVAKGTPRHADALHVIAQDHSHESWPALVLAAETASMDRAAREEALKYALYLGNHPRVDSLLAADPTLARANLGLACALYDLEGVGGMLARDPQAATRLVAGPREPILHLTFSRHHQRAPEKREAMLAIAETLVAHGADVNASYPFQQGAEHRLSALYGALGHADNLPLARWLLEHGATPDDNESLYHATELGHLDGVRLLLEHGVTIAGTNALPRMLDFDNAEGVRLLLEAGADPNEGIAEHPSCEPPAVIPALHQAARRMCSAEVAELLIDHGADGTVPYREHTAYAQARIMGNHAVARVLEAHGQATPLDPVETLLAQAADGAPRGRVTEEALSADIHCILTRLFGFEGRLEHAKRLVALGIDPDWRDEQDMSAIHIAGWEGLADEVAWLLTFDPDLEYKNMYGGNLLGTVIHGSDNAPARARRDHLTCARLVLEAGSPLHRSDITDAGTEEMESLLADWAEAHPDSVLENA
ncbi:ankyrin repeat domain-containing protein [Pontivivens ytuae]|uniref:Ankyrin repeat domain-containing protein n=1 Tax=Pontivivens ytuae TaxID=2789856 RepID=A0A7S9LTS4_9RHOB|nr:ankyrin repeat domain-containing protein [Pontivivens ytuae]QPH55033.1 ankyrin repeat domain-containing protein [Pontivivens ytuae]